MGRVCKFYWWVESVHVTSASQILESFWNITTKKAIFRLSSTWPWHVYTIVSRDTWSSCGRPLSWKVQIHDGGHRVNFDRNIPSSCFVVQYNSLILMIQLRFTMFTINVILNCICCENGYKDKTLLPKISEVEVTPSVNSVESSEQFWHKICPIWHICEPWWNINSENH